jgi:DNA replication protein DnaC
MRTEKRWLSTIQPKLIKQFTPRIQRDLENIPIPKNLKVFNQSTFIWGPVHTGKTIYSIFLLLAHMKDAYLNFKTPSFIFISMDTLLTKIKESYFKGDLSVDNFLEYYLLADVLIIDDIAVEKPSEWAYSVIYTLINTRIEYLRKTIINSNLNLDELKVFFNDDRITSRLDREYIILEKKKL